MKVRFLFALLLFALATSASLAQLAVYGNFDATHFRDNNSQTANWFYGPNIGAYYNFFHFGPLAAGVDLRGNMLFGSHQRYRSALIGVRVAGNAPVVPLKPYAQFSVGVGGSKYGSGSYTNKFQYDVIGGVDYTIFPRIDLRVAEVGYGRMSGVGGGPDTPSSSIVTIGSGIVVRLP
ncbi:MAG TPA: hypothetical protein VFE38_09080 [Edaphobacter sp.]|nr:hypothetical protein [Edaphobacter sp.]